jgi:hypothetical protein
LTIHHQFGHISMRKIQEMARQGIVPRRLAKCRIPTCSACLYSKATKRPWRGKPRTRGDNDETQPTKPGEKVSVDQLVSPTPGLIAQMTGFLTTKRYRYATVYVDQFSRLGFIYLQKTASAEETVEGKKAFEAYASRQGVKIQNYHADNGIFKAYKWLDACKTDGQGMTFAAVNAHHQNGIAERRIRELQELARAMMTHANARWPDTITPNLWPYAVRNANDALNHTPSMQDAERRSPMELFSGSKVATNPKHWKPFGCPTYVLSNELQGNRPFHKWSQRAKAGVYLGKSPQHGRNVALVMDRDSALVSPQFHVAFDTMFDTVKGIRTRSSWNRFTRGLRASRNSYPHRLRTSGQAMRARWAWAASGLSARRTRRPHSLAPAVPRFHRPVPRHCRPSHGRLVHFRPRVSRCDRTQRCTRLSPRRRRTHNVGRQRQPRRSGMGHQGHSASGRTTTWRDIITFRDRQCNGRRRQPALGFVRPGFTHTF